MARSRAAVPRADPVPVGAAWEDVFQVQKHALLESQRKLASEIQRLNTRLQEKKTELLDEALILEDRAGERTAPATSTGHRRSSPPATGHRRGRTAPSGTE